MRAVSSIRRPASGRNGRRSAPFRSLTTRSSAPRSSRTASRPCGSWPGKPAPLSLKTKTWRWAGLARWSRAPSRSCAPSSWLLASRRPCPSRGASSSRRCPLWREQGPRNNSARPRKASASRATSRPSPRAPRWGRTSSMKSKPTWPSSWRRRRRRARRSRSVAETRSPDRGSARATCLARDWPRPRMRRRFANRSAQSQPRRCPFKPSSAKTRPNTRPGARR